MGAKYTKEFKEEAAKLVTEHGYSQAEAGSRLDVSDKNINRWVQESKITHSGTCVALFKSQQYLARQTKSIL